MEWKKEIAPDMDAVATLTPREKQIFYMLLEGMKAKEIAQQASISVSGANYFVKQIYRKLGVSYKAELILRYFSLRSAEHTNQSSDEGEKI